MCVNTNRKSRKTSRSLSMGGSGPLRRDAVNAEGSYAMKGGREGFSVGTGKKPKIFENRAEAEAYAFSSWKADYTKRANAPVAGFGVRNAKPLTFEQAWTRKNSPIVGGFGISRKPAAAPTNYAELVKSGAFRPIGGFGSANSAFQVKSAKLKEASSASAESAQKARPAARAPDPTSAAAAPAPAPVSSPAKKRLRIRPGSSPSATASLGKSGINIAN